MIRRKALNSRLLESANNRIALKVDEVHRRLEQDFSFHTRKIRENGLADSGPAQLILLKVQIGAIKKRAKVTWQALHEVIGDEVRYSPTLAKELKDYVRSQVNKGGYTFLLGSSVLNLTPAQAKELKQRAEEIGKAEGLRYVDSEIDVFLSSIRNRSKRLNRWVQVFPVSWRIIVGISVIVTIFGGPAQTIEAVKTIARHFNLVGPSISTTNQQSIK